MKMVKRQTYIWGVLLVSVSVGVLLLWFARSAPDNALVVINGTAEPPVPTLNAARVARNVMARISKAHPTGGSHCPMAHFRHRRMIAQDTHGIITMRRCSTSF